MGHREAMETGARLGDCEILSVLGEGGFGITYLAWDSRLRTNIALKEYFPSELALRDEATTTVVTRTQSSLNDYEKGLEEFQREARLLARFKHTNIVRVRKFHHANNTAYMVMDYEQGKNFTRWLKDLRRPPTQEELDFLTTGILNALELIHANDMLHRDIAPDNIYIRSNNSPVLLDFGAARQDYATRSHTLQAIVKPGYSPHEQFAFTPKSQGPWTDIYSLSATLYLAITGALPPEAPNRVIQDEYVPAARAAKAEYRPQFLDAIDHGLAVLPRDRPATVEQWRDELLSNLAQTRPWSENGNKTFGEDENNVENPGRGTRTAFIIIAALLAIVSAGFLIGSTL